MRTIEIVTCPNCGAKYCNFDSAFTIDGEQMCEFCVKQSDKYNLPHFYPIVPGGGVTVNIFTFKSSKEFYQKIRKYLIPNSIIVKDGKKIYFQSLGVKFYGGLGFIHHFDTTLIDVPEITDCFYHESGIQIDKQKLNDWLKINNNKQLIYRT